LGALLNADRRHRKLSNHLTDLQPITRRRWCLFQPQRLEWAQERSRLQARRRSKRRSGKNQAAPELLFAA
jgi:hypothetical protein